MSADEVRGWKNRGLVCMRCGNQVEAFDPEPIKAEKKAAGYCNRGIYDLKKS